MTKAKITIMITKTKILTPIMIKVVVDIELYVIMIVVVFVVCGFVVLEV